jgi:V-type H+-transporting ATPase subunit D
LDELEREEFFRLKKIQEKNRKIKAEEQKRKDELKKLGVVVDTEVASMLDDDDDKDILFK